MEYKKLHPQGSEFSRIIAGVWRWKDTSRQQIQSLIDSALDAGITTFDHADIYGDYSCEEKFGEALKGNTSMRTNMQLVTKCGIKLLSAKHPQHHIKHYDTSKQHIVYSVEQSLKNLGTDYLDLLLLHRPDPLLNPEEVAEAFSLLKQNGKVLYFGVSNFSSAQFEMLQSYVHAPLVTNQVELSLFRHEALFDGVGDVLMKHRVSPMAWSPLGGGKFFTASGQDESTQTRLEQLAEKYTCSVSQLLIAWLLHHPSGIFPIVGTTNPERIRESAASTKVRLTRQDWFAMLKIATGHDVA
ncbi:MAG: aldo/keto reductase [Cyclobacteriaceae bacterium]|nr:aldo/keto reductase [Cyclobacteriaceae bacterium]